MGERIGIIAGSGAFVSRILLELKQKGVACVVVGVDGETAPELESQVSAFRWVKPGELGKAISFLKEESIQEVLMLGKLRPALLFNRHHFDRAAKHVWEKTENKSASGVLRAVIGYFEENGFEVRDPLPLLNPFFCREGVLTAAPPSASLLEDIDIGLGVARRLADLEIGQTVIVKDRIIVAVEGLEGTDRAILRGGELVGPGIVAVKAGRSEQDIRLDVPGVGLETIRTLIKARGAALGIEVDKVAFFEREEAVALAEAHGITIAVRCVSRGGE